MIEIFYDEPAVFSRGFDRDVAYAQDALHKSLDDPHILHFGKLDDPCRFGCEAGFVTQLIARNRQFYRPLLDVTFDGPDEQENPQGGQPSRIVIREIAIGKHDSNGGHQERHCISGLDELHAGVNHDVGHAMLKL